MPFARSLPRRTAPEWVDRFLGSDPGLTRLRTALQAVVTIGVAMAAERLFIAFTGALQTPIPPSMTPAQAATAAALNHGLLVIAIMIGAVIGMLASFAGSMFSTPGSLLVTFVLMPVPMTAGLALGLAVGPHRVAALASLAAVLAVGTYCRRFGARGFLGGMVLFMGNFFGFFLHGELALPDLGWLTAEIVIGVLVAALAQFTLFYPSRRAALRRMLRSYTARARDVARRSLELFDQPDETARLRLARLLRRRLVRLNETALMIDARLAEPGAVPPGWSVTLLHQSIFDAELALTNLARFTERLAECSLELATRVAIQDALAAVAAQDLLRAEQAGRELFSQLRVLPAPRPADPGDGLEHVNRAAPIVLHRFASSLRGLVAAGQTWRRATQPVASRNSLLRFGTTGALAADEPLESSITLAAGWLPGSTAVSATASQQSEVGYGLWGRIRLASYSRVAIQMGVAVAAATALGDLLSGRRFYWAVIAAFVTFMGANNAGEQLRKGFYRVAGTVVGVLVGAIGAHLVGNRTDVAIAVILIALFFGLYLMRISYAFMVIGITIMVSQLYVQLDEFSDSLLLLRLEETALGAAVAALTVLCVLPLRTGRVARVAAREYLQALAHLADQAIDRLLEPGDSLAPLRAAARELDAAYQTLLSTMVPLRFPFTGAGDNLRKQFLHAASAARHYARNLISDTVGAAALGSGQRDSLRAAGERLRESLAELIGTDERHDSPRGPYVRSAALFELIAPADAEQVTTPLQLALRDLQLIDGAMAAIARTAGMSVLALDTGAGAASGDAVPGRTAAAQNPR